MDTQGKRYNPTIKASDGDTFSMYMNTKKILEKVTKYHIVVFSKAYICSSVIRKLMEDHRFAEFVILKEGKLTIDTVSSGFGGKGKKSDEILNKECQYILLFNYIKPIC